MTIFYELDSSRASGRELWWGCKGRRLRWMQFIIQRWTRSSVPWSSDHAVVASLEEMVVPELPAAIAARVAQLGAELTALGFQDPVYHQIAGPLSDTVLYWVTLRSADGRHAARVHLRHWLVAAKPERACFVQFLTPFANGTFLVSSSGPPDVEEPIHVEIQRRPGLAVPALWAVHQTAAGPWTAQRGGCAIPDAAAVTALCEELHARQRIVHLQSGFFREETAPTTEAGQRSRSRAMALRAYAARNPDALAALAALEHARPGWAQGIWLLVVSLVAFLVAGQFQWQWRTTLWLVPILLFHEAGHWLAMKAFGYQDLRMFFIPFFGAAVAGRHRNVAGWKKALVALAGPVPGILLGAGLAVAGWASGNRDLGHAALLLVLLNGFNLLPFLPLDGGWFLHATLFSRTWWLDTLFRTAAVVGLIVIGAAGFGRMLLVVAISFALQLPITYKIGRLTDRLRRETPPLVPGLGPDPELTPAQADEWAGEIKRALPGALPPVVAQIIRNLFETLNSRAPGPAATGGLLLIYFAAVAVGLAGALAAVLAGQGGNEEALALAGHAPRLAVTADSATGRPGTPAASVVYEVVTQWGNPTLARDRFEAARKALPTEATALIFGESVIVGLPLGAEKTLLEWVIARPPGGAAPQVLTNQAVRVSLVWTAPSLAFATNQAAELAAYFKVAGEPLIPPWSAAARSPEFTKFRSARAAWFTIKTRLDAAGWGEMGKPAATEGAPAGNLNERIERALTEEAARLKTDYEDTPFRDMVGWAVALNPLTNASLVSQSEIREQLRERLGREPGATGPGVMESGTAFQRLHTRLFLSDAIVREPEKTLPELIAWLEQAGCSRIRYRWEFE